MCEYHMQVSDVCALALRRRQLVCSQLRQCLAAAPGVMLAMNCHQHCRICAQVAASDADSAVEHRGSGGGAS